APHGAHAARVALADGTRSALESYGENVPDGAQHAALDTAAKPPQVWFSWYRVGATVLLGLATGVKWSGIYFFAVFCVISVLWDAWLRRQASYPGWFTRGALGDGLLTAIYMVPIYALTYLATWTGWFIHSDSYMHDWAAKNPGQGIQWLPEGLRSFVEYHREMWKFHTTLDAPHDYKANPLTWPLQIRPTSFYWEKLSGHPGLCSLSPDTQCVAAVTSLGNPIIWWLGSACAIVAIVLAIWKRGDWRIWAVLAGFLGGWLPWAQYLNRTTFTFYSIVLLPWMILAICYVCAWVREKCSHAVWSGMFWTILIICGIVSLYFYPIWTAMPVPYDFWLSHMWLQSWI
ncbi:MAG: phospholipid carrier-dependent glycosyltransferase, partial [Bifidobacterium sp.]|nr:phospholipid carrier-dependent glycosyltransferase [Bifidobacterium sp.]